MTKHIVEYTTKNFTDLKWLKFVLKATSKDDPRLALQCVKVERSDDGAYTITSADGFRIHRARIADLPDTVTGESLPAGLYYTVLKPGMIVFTEGVDLTFPDVDAYIQPARDQTEHTAGKFGINPAYLADLAVKDALITIACSHPAKPVYIQFYEQDLIPGAEAVIMPCRMPE